MTSLEFDENGNIIVPKKIQEDIDIAREVEEANDGKYSRKLARKLRKKKDLST